MFNLFRSKDKVMRYLLGGLLTIVALSMVTYLIPNYNTTGLPTDSPTLADINGKKVTALEAQQRFQRAMAGAQIPPEMLDVYLPQFIENMILQRAAVYQAERMGLTVNDDELLNGVMRMTPQFFPNGQLADRQQLEQFYASQGQTLNQAMDDIRSQLILTKLQNAILETTVVSQKEVEEDFTRKYEKAKIQYLAFAPEKFRDQVKVSDAEIKSAFENNRASYTLPEKNTYRVVVVDQAKVEQTIAVSDAELRQAYASNMDSFRMPERVHARHILLKTEGKTDSDKKGLMTKAEDLVKQLRGGADFFQVAQKNSEDAADKGGDLGWLTKGQTVPEFETAAFALKPKDISNPVTSQFGIHIIQVLEHEMPRIQPFDEVKEALAKDVRSRTISDKMQALTAQVHGELLKDPKAAAMVAEKFKVDVINVQEGVAGQAIPTLGVSPEIDAALSTLMPGQLSEILQLPSERLAMVVLDTKLPKRNAELKEVEAQVRQNLVTQGATKMADDKAKEAGERLKKGEDINQVARAYGLTVTTPMDFSIADQIEGVGSASYMEEAFKKPAGTIIGPQPIQGRAIIAKVVGKVPANMAALTAEHDSLLREIKNRKARERNDLMLDSILAKLQDEGKVSVYQDEIQKLVGSYRTQASR